MPKDADVSRFGVVELDVDGRIVGFDEKPASTNLNTISCGIYVIRRRLLISLLEECIEMEWTDFVRDILMRQERIIRRFTRISWRATGRASIRRRLTLRPIRIS